MSWTYHKCRCGDKVCSQYTISIQGSVGFQEEDAKLICASEDMLEALKNAVLQIEYLHEKFSPTSSGETILTRSRAAIAKATSNT